MLTTREIAQAICALTWVICALTWHRLVVFMSFVADLSSLLISRNGLHRNGTLQFLEVIAEHERQMFLPYNLENEREEDVAIWSFLRYSPGRPALMTKSVCGLHISLIFVVVLCLTSSSEATDEESLLAFKQNIRDPTGVLSDWNNSSSNSRPICSWTGVTCDNQTQRVTNLTLPSFQLAGSISPAIGNLTQLESLDLTNNALSGSIPPEIGNCSHLASILLSGNFLTGGVPLTLGNLQNLTTVRLSSNNLTSTIPSTLGHCSKLGDLDLSENNLEGPIPDSLGNCTRLISLTLTSNFLNGSIPSSFANLLQLQGLLINSNSLTGGFPTELYQLRKTLSEVGLSGNQLTGSLPDKFDEFQALSQLDLSSNNFTGVIPSSLGRSRVLYALNLADNEFTGPLPLSFGKVDKAFQIGLNLSRNLLSGSIDVLGNLVSTVSIDVSKNNFTGGIPDGLRQCVYLTILDVSENFLSGEILGGLASLQLSYLNVSYNNLTGSVDEFTNFTSASFLPGNDGLCGVILNRPCPTSPTEGPPAPTTEGIGGEGTRNRRRTVMYSGGAFLVFAVLVMLASWLDAARVQSTRHLKDCVTCYGRGLQMIRLTVKDLLTATDGFNGRHVIGSGGTSTVYKGLLPFYPFIIAVKKFKDDEDGRQRLLKEAGIMSIVRHRNVVGTLGIASIPRAINVLVLEYVANGTLNQHLHGSEGCAVSWEVRLNIAIDVATAISYLHEDTDQHLAVIHGDLKPANIFLDFDFSAKVGDFGLAKLLVNVDCAQRDDRRWEGTFGYSPPGDVYSFGIVMLEMVTRKRPASLAFEDMGGSFIAWVRAAFPDKLIEIVDPSLKLAENFSFQKDAIFLFFRIGLLCTRNNPRERPTMREALDMIKTLALDSAALDKVPVRPMEELIDESSYTSFQNAKSWGWVNKDFVLDTRDSAFYYDSWVSLFKLDVRDSRTLKAMGFDTVAIKNIRKQTDERREMRDAAANTSWMRTVWRALFRRATSPDLEKEKV